MAAAQREQDKKPSEWHWRDSHTCGQTAAYVFLKLCDVPVSLQSVREAIPIVPEKGANLAEIAKACRRLGLDVEPVRSTPSEFDKAPFPVIAHMLYPVTATRSDASAPEAIGLLHYVVVVGADGNVIQIIDPSSSATSPLLIMTRGAFFRRWTGELLIRRQSVASQWIQVINWSLGGVLVIAAMAMLWRLLRRRGIPVLSAGNRVPKTISSNRASIAQRTDGNALIDGPSQLAPGS